MERIRRAKLVEPLSFANLTEDTQIPVQIDRFWACSKNKEKLQVLSRNFFIKLSEKLQVKLVLSGYDNDASGIQDCAEMIAGLT